MELRRYSEDAGPFFRDVEGFLSPIEPGTGPRRNPAGEFPTGPEIGMPLPDAVALDTSGARFDLHDHRNGEPAVVVFHRSAVW